MANLFFIHTPLQLMIAQMIIEQEKLSDNVMLCGYVDDNRDFLKLYDLIRIEKMWGAIELMDDVGRWALFSRKNTFSGGFHAYIRYCYIRRIIKKNRVNTLFLGDMWNISCQLTAMSYHRKGLNICFFEEGCGHYSKPYDYGKEGNFLDKFYAFFVDLLFFRPFYGVPFGYIHYWKGLTFQDLPMDVRYSIMPFYNEVFDKSLTIKPSMSDRLEEYLTNEIKQIRQKANVLLLTSPLYELSGGRDEKGEDAYVQTIVDYLVLIDKGMSVHIKFHPREKEYIREKLLTELDELNMEYVILGREVNIPVEYYLQYIHYEKVVMFLSSTSFYNGYLFPKVKFESILEDYYNNCKAAGSQSVCLLEPLLKEIPKE